MVDNILSQETLLAGDEKSGVQAVISSLAKRLFDIFASAVGLALLAPIFLYLAWRIRRASPGPVFFRGLRSGKNGKDFWIVKFRTMYESPESYQGPAVTSQDDPRITPLGRWLRDTKLNELPQLWNVLVGEMSLVGPRPEYPEIAAGWPAEARREILSVRPGITSPASILYRDEEKMLQTDELMDTYLAQIAPNKMRFDQLYVRHHSFWTDLDIIFWTLLVLLPQMRTEAPPEARLFAGPIERLMNRHMAWFVTDLITTSIAMAGTALFWRVFIGPLNIGWTAAAVLAIGFALLFSLVNAFSGVNRIVWSRALASDSIKLLPAIIVATTLALLINRYWLVDFLGFSFQEFFGISYLLPPALILLSSGVTYLAFIAVRYRTRLISGTATRWVTWRRSVSPAQERVLVVGCGSSGQLAARVLRNSKYADTLQVVGFVDDDPKIHDSRIHGVNVLGQIADIAALVKEQDIGLILFAIHNITPQERRKLLALCTATAARVAVFPDLPASLHDLERAETANQGPVPLQTVRGIAAQDLADMGASLDVHPVGGSLTPSDDWLARLEQTALSGDLQATLAEIQALRRRVNGDGAT